MVSRNLLLIKSHNKYSHNKNYFQNTDYNIIDSGLLSVEELNFKLELTDKYHIIITSMNAIFALEKLHIAKDIKIFTAGDNSANILQNLGYKNIIAGDNSASSILENIISDKNINKNDNIIYLSGELITLDLSEELKKRGYQSIRKKIYKIKAKDNFSNEIIKKLQNKEIQAIALFSKNAFDVFNNLCQKNNLEFLFPHLTLFTISQNIAQYCREKQFGGKIENINQDQ